MDQPNKTNRLQTPIDASDIICGVSTLSNENRRLKEQVRMLENVNHSLLEEQVRLLRIIAELDTHNSYSEMGVVRDTRSNANSSSSSSLNSGSETHNLYTSPDSGSSSVDVSIETVPAQRETVKLDIDAYNDYKIKISNIMRDFEENKICFIALDGHEIRRREYQDILALIKKGANPTNCMQCEAKEFRTQYKKENHTYTVNTLFMPIFKVCDASPTQEADAPQTTERMLLTKQGLFSAIQANTPPNTATTEETKENTASVNENSTLSI